MTDLVVLWPLGVGAAISAVVVFGLFINSAETHVRYATPQLLWGAAVGLLYWLARLWIKTARGEMHDDPLVYALRDRASLAAVAFVLLIMLLAHSVTFGDDWRPSFPALRATVDTVASGGRCDGQWSPRGRYVPSGATQMGSSR